MVNTIAAGDFVMQITRKLAASVLKNFYHNTWYEKSKIFVITENEEQLY